MMILRKPSILLASYSSFNAIPPTTSGSSTSSLKRKQASTRQCTLCRNRRHNYATIAGDGSSRHGNNEDEEHSWPKPVKGQPCPTPYQIFEMRTNAVYSKARFYELVKLYHPDRKSRLDGRISMAVRTERYRLIVAANDILSDPNKRSAYDRFGAGWNGRAETNGRETWYPGSPGPFSNNWTDDRDGNIWQNATWEDWERFWDHRRKANGEPGEINKRNRAGLYLQNTYFLLVVMLVMFMGSGANYTRAQSEAGYLVESRDVLHDRAAKELRKVKQEALSNGTSRENQIQWFVRNREVSSGTPGSDIEALREEKVDRLLPEREVCRSDQIADED